MVESQTIYRTESGTELITREYSRGIDFAVKIKGNGTIRPRGSNRQYKGKLLAEVVTRMGDIHPERRKNVPVDLIKEGRPAIVAYLYSRRNMSKHTISERLDIEIDAVEVYLSQFLSGER